MLLNCSLQHFGIELILLIVGMKLGSDIIYQPLLLAQRSCWRAITDFRQSDDHNSSSLEQASALQEKAVSNRSEFLKIITQGKSLKVLMTDINKFNWTELQN